MLESYKQEKTQDLRKLAAINIQKFKKKRR